MKWNQIKRTGLFNKLSVAMVVALGLSGCAEDEAIAQSQGRMLNNIVLPLCDFAETACQYQINDLTLSLQISPSFAPSETPIEVTLTTSKPLENVSLSLAGRDMYMGYIPVSLTAMSSQQYEGEMLFGRCATDYMVWRANVRFRYQGVESIAMFDFIADADKNQSVAMK